MFSTDQVVAKGRASAVEKILGETLAALSVTKTSSPLTARLNWKQLGALRLVDIELGPITFTRSQAHLRDLDDGFSLVSCTKGRYQVASRQGDVVPVAAGMAALISHQDMSVTTARQGMSATTLVMPRNAIKTLFSNPDELAHMPPAGGFAALGLLSSYMAGLLEMKKTLTPSLERIAQGHILDLLANAYDPTGEWARAAPNEGVGEARLQQLLGLFATSYASPHASAKSFGAKLGISDRLVHKTLEKTGLSFSEHLLEKRLQAAHDMLQNPAFTSLRIIDIALAVGFSDVSYFNRCFRIRFGDTPGSMR